MKNKNDVIAELQRTENRIDDLRARITIANKLDFKIESGILFTEYSLLGEMKVHLQDVVKMLEKDK